MENLSLASLYANADIVVKCVIYVLVMFSVLSWGIFLAKVSQFFCAFRVLKADREVLIKSRILDDLSGFCSGSIASLGVKICKDEIKLANDTLYLSDCKHNRASIDFGGTNFNQMILHRINLRLENLFGEILSRYKRGVAFLASISSSAPFIGLFGTVWGIMNSFIGIAKTNSATLSAVAPGIAEALFATTFGLIAAIPAVIFYNLLTRLSVRLQSVLSQITLDIYLASQTSLSKETMQNLHKS